jgi:CRP-like cAMP-binding protein
MLRLVKREKAASAGDHSLDWLKPFMTRRAVRAGEPLFHKDDEAAHMYYVLDGRLRIGEIGVDIAAGAVVGELGMLAPNQRRTQTVVCTENATILEISYERIEQLYFQNPEFGFYFLRLSSARLFDNIDRLERTLAEREHEIRQLRAAQASLRG